MSGRTHLIGLIRASSLIPGDRIEHPSKSGVIIVDSVLRSGDFVRVSGRDSEKLVFPRGMFVSVRA